MIVCQVVELYTVSLIYRHMEHFQSLLESAGGTMALALLSLFNGPEDPFYDLGI